MLGMGIQRNEKRQKTPERERTKSVYVTLHKENK